MNPNSSAALQFGQRSQLSGAPGSDLESLSTFSLPNGCAVLVNQTPSIPDFFVLLKEDDTTPPDGVNVIQPGNGPGRWARYSWLYAGGGGPVPAISVTYNDGLAPPYGSTNVQGALDAIKPLLATAQADATQGINDAAAAQLTANNAAIAAANAQATATAAGAAALAAGAAAAAAQTTANNAQTDATAALAGLTTKADKTTTISAGDGLTGGGDLSANRTLAVQPSDGSIVAAPAGVSVGVISDTQHGNRGGGALHADVVAAGASGFMTGADKTKLDGITPGAGVASVSGTAPIVSSGGTTPAISISAATTLAAGSMSAADKSKLDGIAAGAAALTGSAPVDVTKSAAAVGVATDAARSDHKHDVSTAAPSTIGTANAEGSATSLARSDHVHNHGAQTDGSLHAVAIAGGANGFMSGTDKTKVDALSVPSSQTFGYNAAVQTWNKPAGSFRTLRMVLTGSGAGGGGACGAAAGSGKGGGGGGGSAAKTVLEFRWADVPSTLYITVPDGGAGGNGGTSANGTDGTDGGLTYVSVSNTSTIAANLYGVSGNSVAGKGARGTSAAGAGGAGGAALTTSANTMNIAAQRMYFNSVVGVTGSNAGTVASNSPGVNLALSINSMIMAGTGGGSSTNADSAGGAIPATANTPFAGLAGGTAGGGAGNNGTQETGYPVYNGGTGGGSSNSTTGGKGGDGTQVGCGGGGGGGGTTTGGAGGKGGPGEAYFEWF